MKNSKKTKMHKGKTSHRWVKEELKELDLSNPKDCKWYLENMTLNFGNGEKSTIKEFGLENGRTIKVSEMNDSQLIQYANQMFNDLDLPSQKARMT